MFSLRRLRMNYDRLIAFDIDGVVLDIYPHLRQLVFDEWGVDMHPLRRFTTEIRGHTKEEFTELWKTHLDEMTRKALLCENAKEIIKFSKYITINFVTARPFNSMLSTYSRLSELLNLKRDKFTIDFVGDYKIDTIRNLDVRYFVEDRLLIVNEVASLTDVEEVFLIDRDWNKGRIPHPKVTRVRDIREVIERIIFNSFRDSCPVRRETSPINILSKHGAYHCKCNGLPCKMKNCHNYHFTKALHYERF